MRLSRSTFYYRPKGKSLEKLQEDMDIEDEIERICLEFPRYGYRRVTKELQRRRWRVNHKRVLKD
jgi:putative transposase